MHGITSTPYTVRPMGEWLAARGISVAAPLLPGHGRTWRALERTTWHDWYGAVEAAYLALRRTCRRVYAAGLSMGGLQALHLAAHRPELAGVVALAPAAYLDDRRLRFLPLVRVFARTIGAIGGDVAELAGPQELYYPRLPLASLDQLLRQQRHVREELGLIRCPALVMQSARDNVVPPGNARFVWERLGSARKRLVMLHRSAHVVTLDRERERVFRASLALMRGAR